MCYFLLLLFKVISLVTLEHILKNLHYLQFFIQKYLKKYMISNTQIILVTHEK